MSGFSRYDVWRTTNPEDERAAKYEDMRERLAAKRGCDPADVSDADLDDWLNELTADRDAAREDYSDYLRELDID